MAVKRIRTLDGFRGIFALMIILLHANNNTILTQNFLVRNSDYFVDYFFVLSGFVISYNYTSKIKDFDSFKNFIIKRIIRLYPLLLYTTLLFFGFIVTGKILGAVNSEDSYGFLSYKLADTLTLMNSTPVFGSFLSINYPSWSISSEMISYTLFGLALFAFKKNATALLSLFFAGCTLFIIYKGEYLFIEDFGFIRGLFCFILGYFVCIVSGKIITSRFSTTSELLFVSGLLLSLKYIPRSYAVTLPFIFALGIFIFINGKGIVSHFLETRPIQFLGRISYSVYLNHALVLVIVQKVVFDLFKLNKSGILINMIYMCSAILLTIIYSYFTNKYIETGVGNLLKRRVLKKNIRHYSTSNSLLNSVVK
jgi:peptidoglycan/LPS O-acetylase OafA/YrhL